LEYRKYETIFYIISMRKFFLVCAFVLFSCGLHDFDMPIKETKMVEALQQALVLGSKTAASNLGDSSCISKDCVTGYLGNKLVEIAVPDTVREVLSKINSFTNSIDPTIKPLLAAVLGPLLDLGEYGDSIKVALNRGAEKAAPASIDVFRNAIFGMSFSDARGLLLGNDSAATSYLHNATYKGLQTAFALILEEPLDLLNPNKYWKPIASNYNSFAKTYSGIPSYYALPALPYSGLPEDLSKYLAEYATGKALDGLFLMVGKKETELRADPWGTVKASGGFISDSVGDLLGDIFTKAKDNQL